MIGNFEKVFLIKFRTMVGTFQMQVSENNHFYIILHLNTIFKKLFICKDI